MFEENKSYYILTTNDAPMLCSIKKYDKFSIFIELENISFLNVDLWDDYSILNTGQIKSYRFIQGSLIIRIADIIKAFEWKHDLPKKDVWSIKATEELLLKEEKHKSFMKRWWFKK